MKRDVTYLGQVINVNSSAVEVKISDDIPSSAPIVEGKIYRIGQIGSFVKFPIGSLILFGVVSSVSNTPSKEQNDDTPNYGSRYLTVQLIGEKQGDDDFQKGVGFYPTINDEVHLVTENDLLNIYGSSGEVGLVKVGTHSSSERLPVYLDLDKLILRHSAILGSTGSGKSNTTAHILKSIVNNNQGSRVVLIDIHGEYKDAFTNESKVFRINDSTNPLFLPFWLMNFDELAMFLVNRPIGMVGESPQDKRLRQEITERKKENAENLKAGRVNDEFVTSDSPIPFDMKQLWYDLAREIVATYTKSPINEQTRENEAEILDEGSAENLIYPKFIEYSMTNSEPFKSKHEAMVTYEKKILSKLKDSRFNFMFEVGDYKDFENYDLDHLLRSWIEHDKPLTILDLSGVPFELIDLVVGVISRFIFDGMYWGRKESYTGRQRPLLMVYEEAHSYLPNNSESKGIFGYARKAVEKIYKEGRKFGLGSMVITQRPSEISHTILAQVGTYIALRLTNSSDKSTVSSSAPNNMTSLIDLLPSLRVGEAIIVGESIRVPSRVRIPIVDPRPSSNDPKVYKAWQNKFNANEENYKSVVTSIRTQKPI